jgi:hypothetical protein
MAAVCEWFGLKTTQTVYSGLASKPAATVSGGLTSKSAAMVSSGLASKPTATVSGGLASKPAVTVFPFGPQNRRLRFDDLGFKITVMVFLVWALKASRLRFVGCATKPTEGGQCETCAEI